MQISVRAFASYREAIGQKHVVLDIPPGATAAQVWELLQARFPALARLPRPVAFAVNDAYVGGDTVVRERDELVLIPPVSGGEGPAPHLALVEGPIDLAAVLEAVRHPQAGAVVLFLGTVRDNRRGARVDHLEYEAYETLALREMGRVAAEAAARWPVLRVAMVHRLGVLQVGEVSVAIAVSAPHRRDAFEAGRFAIDALKQTVPIWKKEVWEGGEVWVGSEPAG
ncbi:MAG: molybdenum cofactor biosynthesis protein MoaE [Armatimonadota bacterium]|nr:molybdenum cofactor biosynthesis protein MoaE [Armatimonadota bacterium]MDR7452020.1 molybdenum cofactor biosynthesis protein MoaE [Armatimonadota bacterium]MDR7467911.1 molybdenum cofactor biosynthesis protein MoaE [Armatimonadota bacterium]MDR7494236.1 molybdenum cofactor biosynthesis protein MoaE [Armatimonadota bacterium]MDR7500017.1 molybdenum cofactor biosynthesis protein MoaE [Armatimonadota bacterium]